MSKSGCMGKLDVYTQWNCTPPQKGTNADTRHNSDLPKKYAK